MMTSSFAAASSPKQKQKQRVHFFEQVRVCPTLSYFDYTKREMRSCWYTAEEQEQIRQEANEAVRMLTRREKQKREQELHNKNLSSKQSYSLKMNKSQKKKEEDNEIICTRGLEHLTKPANRWRRHIRRTAASAVFDEMDRQILEQPQLTKLDSELIAIIYSELTKGSQLSGYATGLADYKAAYPERQYDDDVAMSDNKKKDLLHNLFHYKTKNDEEHKRLLRLKLSAASRRHNAGRISVTI